MVNSAEELVRAVRAQYDEGRAAKAALGLFETVKQNENFFIGRQWEGVQSGGLPTPVFNFLKRVILFMVASITTENIKMQASPLGFSAAGDPSAERAARVVSSAFESIFERGAVANLVRELLRNAAVDGDGCLYAYFDPEIETGEAEKGAVCTELVDNTRVFFADTAERAVQKQKHIIIASRRDAKELSELAGEEIKPDGEAEDGKTELLLRFRREKGKIMACETTREKLVRPEWDTGLTLYPLSWMSWDAVPGCCHGQAAVTGLIPNQIFVNKLFAMSMISLMSNAYPKIVFDRTKIARWDNRVGAAIGVTGDTSGVATAVGAQSMSPQISQFIALAVDYTQNFMGATDTALGNVDPRNTSAIIAVQKASNIPLEMVKQNLYQCLEEMGRVYIDIMRAYYGERLCPDGRGGAELFDFSSLSEAPMKLRLDVGSCSYWSEVASVQTLDNLLKAGHITLSEYLERLPDGFVTGREELIAARRAAEAQAQGGVSNE